MPLFDALNRSLEFSILRSMELLNFLSLERREDSGGLMVLTWASVVNGILLIESLQQR